MPQKIPGVWGLAPNEVGKISDLPIDSFKDRRCYFADGPFVSEDFAVVALHLTDRFSAQRSAAAG